ncbi:excinuclease ABC subunit UvrC [Ligilactobacillus sp. WILCCON 0076]|uniref:UvrABC system protein C n=1 Tax=Ligilactobacillus ubinensis TaxID=2876789 RepID=A0A9X2JKY9_9LACO|nr:excinuclease ABC subunit UvrC [Ligilactobacillus ubinensis]MCP0886409.1 excinuclease ABC subunit UvrC [Ligilactobacillus ubinensis]
MATEYIENKLKLLPDLPGCYIMKDLNSRIIYVGKAKNLKNRVRSYFKSSHEGKTAKLVAEIRDFETIITSTDKEAFLLEITLIQKHKPYYNIKLKRGTGYPYIKITKEKDPQIKIVSQIKKDGGYYFGPYPNVYAATETMQLIQKAYPLRRCTGYQKRPCLYYHMGQCLGACFKEVPQSMYEVQIKKIKAFLNGNVGPIKRSLYKKMEEAAANLEFERAAELRDQIHYVEVTVEKQKIISNDNTPRDLFAYYMDKGWLSIQVFSIRQARLMKREKRLFPCIDTPESEMTSFILQFYNQKNRLLPREILVPSQLDKSILGDIFDIPVKTPQRGKKLELLNLAQKNAQLVLEEKFRLLELDERKTSGAVEEIMSALKIVSGHRIEAFDHSHIQGTDLVSAMVCYVDGRPQKDEYRKYKLKNVDHADEAASTREVIFRRYSRLLKEKQQLPDLILMDGAEIQIEAAKDVLNNQLGIDIPIAGMVKNSKHKTADLMTEKYQKINLDPKSEGFYLLQRIQDEVHRFAITFHRQVHSRNSLASRLEMISGVGPKTRVKLLRNYTSLKKISEAPIEKLEELGISAKVAKTIKLSLKSKDI